MTEIKNSQPFWEGLCPEPQGEDELDVCRFMLPLKSRIVNKVRLRIKKDSYPKTYIELLEYIQTATFLAMKELIMAGYRINYKRQSYDRNRKTQKEAQESK